MINGSAAIGINNQINMECKVIIKLSKLIIFYTFVTCST
ncbi:hypothetical protein XNA1_3180010 [Xenorhabdus nematophila str. Anatoliense]|nr:hypothetical protein XNA1_200010 [Xenorhabdus nematophila str. Anatoliense]CEE92909.1 hypothetical protein XNA1_3180010 [Xenorhabdus nematophila str. Anatoliense]